MAELLNEIRFLIFLTLINFPARALDVILSGAHQDFKQKSEINIGIVDGEKIYLGTLNQLNYEAQDGTSKVIVYIISRSRCIEILRPAVSGIRWQIAQELRRMHYELVFLGIEHIDDDEYHLIGAFILEKIQPHPDRPDIIIETIGENRFDQFYGCYVIDFEKYQENAQICGGILSARLRSIPHGALRPVESNDKEIKLFGYHPFVREVRWPIHTEGNQYLPDASVSDPKYDFMIKYPNMNICLLILSGKEYSTITVIGNRGLKREKAKYFFHRMTTNDEVLIILGAFNFDWTEINIVTQIILKHSESWHGSAYNVFTCGYGMFNTYYLNENEDDERRIRQQPNSYVSKVIKILMNGKEVKQRAINVYYYYDDDWKVSNESINLSNGQYVPESRFINFTLPCQYEKIAFIVYDGTEMNYPIDYAVVVQSVAELGRSGISVALIEAFNFGSNDMHIIAEWIDRHSGVINWEQIAVLGGGIFETIFQSESTTYNAFLNTNKIELKIIRNAYVKSGDEKRVSVINIDEFSNLEIWSYPMNTVVNGFYELDLIPDKNMFDTTDGMKISFIITSAYYFQRIAATKDFKSVTKSFGQDVSKYYPNRKWNIFLVGLDNFRIRDSHLFAELVKRQTNDERSFGELVRAFNYGINRAIYQYKDTAPFDVGIPYSHIIASFTRFFWMLMSTSI